MKESVTSPSIAWLADAPLFIDSNQVRSFYDAVVRPESETGTVQIELTQEVASKLTGGVTGDVEAKVPEWIAKLFAGIGAKVGGNVGGEQAESKGTKRSLELRPISTPQRQLVQLSLHYAANAPTRLQLLSGKSLAGAEWREPASILGLPRALVFIDLPSENEAQGGPLPRTKLIPLAAEFANGEIALFFEQLRSRDGRETPPPFPEDENRDARKAYWQWFDRHFDAGKAIRVVEAAASNQGRLRWIDYRVPLNADGDTLHLHFQPAEQYDTGVFAYNLIKRGHAHGLRLVGSLRSEPSLNVLAVFEK